MCTVQSKWNQKGFTSLSKAQEQQTAVQMLMGRWGHVLWHLSWQNFMFLLFVSSPSQKKQSKRREEKQANLAVPCRNCFGVVTVVEAVNAVLKFLAYQSLIFPAAFRIGQPHPLAQVFRVIWGCFATVCCKICTHKKKPKHQQLRFCGWTTSVVHKGSLNHPYNHKTGLG